MLLVSCIVSPINFDTAFRFQVNLRHGTDSRDCCPDTSNTLGARQYSNNAHLLLVLCAMRRQRCAMYDILADL